MSVRKSPGSVSIARSLISACAVAAASASALAYDYPTVDRVVFVQTCERDHPGNYYEMISKCSCALDTIAKDIPFDDFVSMSTATNANTIGGERGSYIRDVPALQDEIRKLKQIQAAAMKSCFVDVSSPH